MQTQEKTFLCSAPEKDVQEALNLIFLKKNNTNPTFVIDFPQIAISPDTHSFIDLLKASTIEYTLVTDGYITFEGRAFGCNIPLMFGIHFNALKIEFIEIFRPQEYYLSDSYDINESLRSFCKCCC